MEKICICTKNIGVWHSFEKMKPQLCFFFKKLFLVMNGYEKYNIGDNIICKIKAGLKIAALYEHIRCDCA